MAMPGRKNTNITASESYRYAYNGMEQDNEVSGNGNSYTTEFRQYDPRLGRWKSLDPLMAQFPWMSPYVAFDNNPIYYLDRHGLSATPPDNIHVYEEDGRIEKEETTDKTNTYFLHKKDGTVVDLGTYNVKKNVSINYGGKNVTKDMINLKDVDKDFVKTKYVESGNTYLDENVAAAFLAAAYDTKKSTGKKVYINQLNGGTEGGHSEHGSYGDRIDLQYMGKNHKEGRLHTTSSNFDKEASTTLVENLKKYGLTRFYTQASEGSAKPAIEGTTGGVNPHHHHLHADVSDNGGTIMSTKYKPPVVTAKPQTLTSKPKQITPPSYFEMIGITFNYIWEGIKSVENGTRLGN